MNKETPCPCCSGKTYGECCKKWHQGEPAENALALMRSRYSAYALRKADYIIATTHPSNPSWQENREDWKRDILSFSRNTRFNRLEILDFKDGAEKAEVTFIAHLTQGERDATFREKSSFVKEGERWLYKEGMFK